jgi:hypothetical protein
LFDVFSCCGNSESQVTDTSDQCAQLDKFTGYSDLVDVSCDEHYFHVHSETGLPDIHDSNPLNHIMVGITAWINRVPIPYEFNWKIPRSPVWLHEYEEASPRGPIAMAVNGVPIFHFEPRPDVSTDPANYDPRFDTVLAGELDQCGGHSGQGDDYHYHYAPVYLLDQHDLEKPIVYGLDGIPLFFGTGGTDYYGSGRYNDVDNLPDQELDECNALQQEDGSYVYFTTNDAPYTIGCHRGHIDSSLQIEPRPFNGREQETAVPTGHGLIGEPLQTVVTNLYQDEEGDYHLEHDTGDGVSATIYRKIEGSDDCWELEYRQDVDQPGIVESYCR